MISIIIADDHALVREGVIELLDKNKFMVIGEAANGLEAVEKYNELQPDIILMDMKMPHKNGLEASKEIITKHPKAKIVTLTVELSEADLMNAIDLPVKGYILKTTTADSLNQSLSLIANGESVFPSDAIINGLNHRMKNQEAGLTKREEEILKCIAVGSSNKQIARDLDITEGTVKVHIKSILKKLGMTNRTQAAIYAYENGI